jgi:S-adenosylmethionine/arginine decarboxylase-like enzyme
MILAHAKLIAGSIVTLFILAQEFPMPDWAKLGVSLTCIVALSYVMIFTYPALFRLQVDAAQKQMDAHQAVVAEIVSGQRDTTNEFVKAHREESAEMRGAIERQTVAIGQQTTAITSAIAREYKKPKPGNGPA